MQRAPAARPSSQRPEVEVARFHIDKLRALGSRSRDPTQDFGGQAPQAGRQS